MDELGRLPVVGDEVLVDGGTLRVERLDGRRIDRIRFTREPEPGTDTGPGTNTGPGANTGPGTDTGNGEVVGHG
jgi:hypothetical protein